MNHTRISLTLAGLVSASVLLAGCAPPRSVVLLTVDTLRADRIGLYGGGSLPTPNIDALGHEGIVAEQCVAPFGRTTQSVGTILTGLHPLRHGADGLGMSLSSVVETLPETLRGHGYETAAFTSNLMLRPGLGFDQGFGIYVNPEQRWFGNSAGAISNEGLAWLRSYVEQPNSGPFFLWLHYLDPHWPYRPDPELARLADPEWSGAFWLQESGPGPKEHIRFNAPAHLSEKEIEHARRLYDAEVAGTDRAIGEFLAGLDELGISDSVLVVFTSDHGESLGEHSYWFGHGEYLYDETLVVPLLLRAPGLLQAGQRLPGLTRLEDIAPTVLDLLGIETSVDVDGRSFADAIRDGGKRVPEDVAELQLTDHILVREPDPRRPLPGREGRWRAVRENRWKLIQIPLGSGENAEELYDLANDPNETTNLLDRRPEEAERLRLRLTRLAESVSTGTIEQDDPSLEEHMDTLRGLGYAQ